jgi:hypothetical protein
MAASKDSDGPKVREAEALLREVLPCGVSELRRLARERDIGFRSLQRAKARLRVVTTQPVRHRYAWSFDGTKDTALVLDPAEHERHALAAELADLSRGQLVDRIAVLDRPRFPAGTRVRLPLTGEVRRAYQVGREWLYVVDLDGVPPRRS